MVRMQLVRYCHKGNIGTVGWSAEEGQALCCDWTGENGGGHGFREFVILYALCHKSSLLEWLRSIEWILNLFNVPILFLRFNLKLIFCNAPLQKKKGENFQFIIQ